MARQARRLRGEHILSLHWDGMGAGELDLVAHSLGSRVPMECLRFLEPAVRPRTKLSTNTADVYWSGGSGRPEAVGYPPVRIR